MGHSKLALLVGLALVAVVVVGTASAASNSSSAIPVVQDSQLQARTTTIGGARPQPTTRTVQHWAGTSVNPDDGVTYAYNMVGADPYTCGGASCDSTIPTDIIPVDVVIQYGGSNWTFNGTDVVSPTLSSPVFSLDDYGSTPAATVQSCGTGTSECRGPGGVLSQGDAGNQLQLEDATMRAQFDRTGASNYHVRLGAPTLHAPITIVVPQSQGALYRSGRGVIFAGVSDSWWSTRIQNLNASLGYLDPTHLPIYLTNNVLLDSAGCVCVIGFHGASEVRGKGTGAGHGNGDEPIQTYAWASYLQAGIYARANGGTAWALQDIQPLSHEISEWADDPFVDNNVEPWLTPTAPQYGCTPVLETGDPVVGIGFAKGANTFEQGPNPDGTESADGYYHPEDEVFLPWFMRLPSNNTGSEENQSGTGGRYTLMGDLNPFPGFRMPATGC
jgi:hypothetical protein